MFLAVVCKLKHKVGKISKGLEINNSIAEEALWWYIASIFTHHLTQNMSMFQEEIKSHFPDVDAYLSKETQVMEFYTYSLEDVKHLSYRDKLAHLQAELTFFF